MDRILSTYRFGPHRVDVVEAADDEGIAAYYVLVDQMVTPESPLLTPPRFEEVVRLYAAWQRRQEASAAVGQPEPG